jgi:hypothetical protein
MYPLQARAWDLLEEIDRTCVAAGWPAISAPWWQVLRESWESPVCVTRGGRRSGKSSTYCRKACAVALAADPIPGDTGVFAIYSANRIQAADRVSTCEQIFNLMGYKSIVRGEPKAGEIKPMANAIVLPDNIEIRVVTASVSAAVSSTLIGAFADEVAHWDDQGRNPADEIIRMILPSMATVPGAMLDISSAPKTSKDAHARFYKRAQESDSWAYAHMPTWVGNPTLSLSRCKEIAQDEYEFLRAFAAQCVDFGSAVMFPDHILDRAFMPVDGEEYEARACGVDMGLTRNHSAAVIAGPDRFSRQRIAMLDFELWAPRNAPLIPSATARAIAAFAGKHGLGRVTADVFYRETLREHIAVSGGTTTAIALHNLRRTMLEDRAAIPIEWDKMRGELGRIEYRDDDSVIVPQDPDGSHCDLAMAGAAAMFAADKSPPGQCIGGRANRRGRFSGRGGRGA